MIQGDRISVRDVHEVYEFEGDIDSVRNILDISREEATIQYYEENRKEMKEIEEEKHEMMESTKF